jgi:hypothetical protein
MESHKSHVPNHQPAYYTMGLLDPVIIPSNGPTESFATRTQLLSDGFYATESRWVTLERLAKVKADGSE